MGRAAMALAQALKSVAGVVGQSAAFEALEPRSLLSAPVVSGTIVSANKDRLVFQVHFAAGSAGDPVVATTATVGVTGPNGFAQLVRPYVPVNYYDLPPNPWVSDGAGGYFGMYVAASPEGFLDNGTYTIGVAAGAVHSQHGDGNAAGGAGQVWLWFPDSQFGSVSGDLDQNQLRILIERWDRGAAAEGTNIQTLFLQQPNGDFRNQNVNPDLFTTSSRVHVRGTVEFLAPGDTWDFPDNGTYTVWAPTFTNGVRTGSVLVAQYYLWFGPHVDLVSSQVTAYSWSVTVRYTGSVGIDLTSVGNQNAYFKFGGGELGSPLVSRFGLLVAPPTLNSNGSIDATYVYFTGPQGFTAEHGGMASVAVFGVRGTGGDYMYGQTMDTHVFSYGQPLVMSVDGSTATSTHWSIVVGLGYSNFDQSNITADDLRIEGPGGAVLTPTGVSFTFDNGYHITYSLEMPSGQHLESGQYQAFMKQGALTFNGGASSEVLLGSWWLWFAA